MDDPKIVELFLKRFGLRIQPEMGRYILARMKTFPGEPIAIMGGDARTGVAVRRLVGARELSAADSATQASD